ncbi:MAG TPA: hypothetical protein VNO30_40795, partial [Kofleriaceae bacterium]|nr:hypothetical protein [Kofleriaceae bacterium]
MGHEPDRPMWRGQRPWFEAWFAVLLDASRRRSLWVRQTILVPRQGEGRATIWGAWFDADAERPARAAKRYAPLDQAKIGEGEELIRIEDSWMTRSAAAGSVEGLAWDVAWSGGRHEHAELPSWLPAPTHAAPIAQDADVTGQVTLDGQTFELRGRARAAHLWGKRRVPTLHWIWSPWTGDSSLEVLAVSLRDRFALGIASLRLDPLDPADANGPEGGPWPVALKPGAAPRARPSPIHGSPATAAHANCLVTATVAGA